MSDEDDDGPRSDPYCIHWISLCDDEHSRLDIRCENCGEPCSEHDPRWGGWCSNAPTGTKDRERYAWKNATWPANAQSPVKPVAAVEGSFSNEPGAAPDLTDPRTVAEALQSVRGLRPEWRPREPAPVPPPKEPWEETWAAVAVRPDEIELHLGEGQHDCLPWPFDPASAVLASAAPDMARVLLSLVDPDRLDEDGRRAGCPTCGADTGVEPCADDCALDAALRKAGVR